MSKRHHQNKTHSTNRVHTSVSVDPEAPQQVQEEIALSRPSFNDGFIPSYEDIQRRAYHIHEEKGGSDLENWLEAERNLKEEHQVQD